jgi:hypothetical protein
MQGPIELLGQPMLKLFWPQAAPGGIDGSVELQHHAPPWLQGEAQAQQGLPAIALPRPPFFIGVLPDQ